MQCAPSESTVLPMRLAAIKRPEPVGKGPGFTFCAAFAAERAQGLAVLQRGEGFWDLLVLKDRKNLVPESSLTGFLGYRDMALELVCGADFSCCKLMCGPGPGDLGGSRGSVSAKISGKTAPKLSSQTAFRYPEGLPASQMHACAGWDLPCTPFFCVAVHARRLGT